MLLQGNCLSLLTKEIMDKVDIIITDLPYGVTNNKIDTPLDLIKM
jgi:DNA modification methylase